MHRWTSLAIGSLKSLSTTLTREHDGQLHVAKGNLNIKPWGWSCQLEPFSTGFHPVVWNEKFSILYKKQKWTWWQGRTLDWRGREQGCKIWHWHVFHYLLGSPLLAAPEKWLEVLHACVIAFLQLVLVSLLVLLDELAVPFQGISWLLQKVLVEYSRQIFGRIWDTLKQSLSLFSCLLGTLPSKSSCKKTRAISMGPCEGQGWSNTSMSHCRVVTWLTVVPMLPCSSICRIFGSFDLIAESSFATWSNCISQHINDKGSPPSELVWPSSVCPRWPPQLESRWSASGEPPVQQDATNPHEGN